MYLEVEVSQMILDPNVIDIIDIFFGSDKLVIVMEYCGGKFLTDSLINAISEADLSKQIEAAARFYKHFQED